MKIYLKIGVACDIPGLASSGNEVLAPRILNAVCQGESGFPRTSWQQDSVASFQLKR